MARIEEETFVYNLKCRGCGKLNDALCVDNGYCDIKQNHIFRKRAFWPTGFLQLEFNLSNNTAVPAFLV